VIAEIGIVIRQIGHRDRADRSSWSPRG